MNGSKRLEPVGHFQLIVSYKSGQSATHPAVRPSCLVRQQYVKLVAFHVALLYPGVAGSRDFHTLRYVPVDGIVARLLVPHRSASYRFSSARNISTTGRPPVPYGVLLTKQKNMCLSRAVRR